MSKEALKLALEALDMMVVPRGFQAQVRVKEIYDTIKETLAQVDQPKVRTGACLLVGVCASEGHKIQKEQSEQKPVAIADGTFNHNCPIGTPLYITPPQHVLMAEHWKSMYEQLKVSVYTPDDGALTEEQINQLKKTAPKRLWVSLTHEDIDKAIEDNQRFGGFRKVGFAYDLEAILKEKNT